MCVFEVISVAMKRRNGAKFTETERRKVLYLFNYLLSQGEACSLLYVVQMEICNSTAPPQDGSSVLHRTT